MRTGARSWDGVDEIFLHALEGFDANVVDGLANQGDIQNGKGDFLNDVLALLLENCTGVELASRGGVPGLIFPTHKLDITYPSEGLAQFLLEAKAVGIPKYGRNPKQRNPLGRPGSADLDKRVKEASFKTIDLKAEYGRLRVARGDAAGPGPGGNLTTWLRENKPRSYLFVAARVVHQGDRETLFRRARYAAQVMDGVGVYAFRPLDVDHPSTYRPVDVPRDIELSAVLFRACQDITAIPGPELPPEAGERVEEAAELLEVEEAAADEAEDEET